MQDLMPPISTPDGVFHDGNPATGEIGTLVTALWLNAVQSATRSVQAEMASVLAAAGIKIDPAKANQVADAIKKLAWGTTDGRPTTLEGYGITDAASLSGASNQEFNVAAATKPSHAVPKSQGDSLYAALLASAHGQCRLVVAGPKTLKLMPCNGNNLIIDGVPRKIPAAGVPITNAGLANYTVYYAYAYMGATDLALELDGKGHAIDPITGIEIKIGDPSRTLVGMVSTVPGGNTFADTAAYRLCLNWFNRRGRAGSIMASGQISFSNTNWAEIHAGMRVYFLCWADEAVSAGVNGHLTNNSANNSTSIYSVIDGSIFGAGVGAYVSLAGAGTVFGSRNSVSDSLAEGVHIAQVFGAVTGGSYGTALSLVNELLTRG